MAELSRRDFLRLAALGLGAVAARRHPRRPAARRPGACSPPSRRRPLRARLPRPARPSSTATPSSTPQPPHRPSCPDLVVARDGEPDVAGAARDRGPGRHGALRAAGRERHRQAQHLRLLSHLRVRGHDQPLGRGDAGEDGPRGRGEQRQGDGLPVRRRRGRGLREERHPAAGGGGRGPDGGDVQPQVRQHADPRRQVAEAGRRLRRDPQGGRAHQRARSPRTTDRRA